MRAIAGYVVHYGKEYLEASVRSISQAVDEVHLLYAAQPTFGHHTDLMNPDSEQELKEALQRGATVPTHWHRGQWANEGQHRNELDRLARERGAEVILVVDTDEVWEPAAARQAVEEGAASPFRNLRARFLHFWRSVRWVCQDPCMPVRVINLKGNGDGYLDHQTVPVFHFGYAQSAALVRYKESIHGHKGEWRAGWFQNKFLPWRPGCGMRDVHPTCVDFWTPEPVPGGYGGMVENLLVGHPYLEKEWIE